MAKSKVLQAVVEVAGSISPTLGKSINEATKTLEKIDIKALATGAAVGGIAIATAKAVTEAGKYLKDLGSQFDGATDAIRIGTGATGEALEGLTDDFEAVYSEVPTSMEDASKAIADYNTRLGLTGPALQEISAQAIQTSDMLGEDLGGVIEESSQAFQAWNMDADKMGDAMDYVFKASQSTGVGFSDLMSNVQQFAPQLQELDYGFEESVALLGQLDKAGVNASEIMSALKKSVGTLAKEGLSASEGMELYTEKIKNAKDMTEATTIASEIFGARAGSTMAAAIRDGTISVADLTSELENNKETIAGAAEDTYDYAERLQVFKQKTEVALKPLANTVFDSINELMPLMEDAMQQILPVISQMSETLIPIIQDLIPKLMPLLQDLIPIIVDIAGDLLMELIPPVIEIVTEILPVLIQLFRAVMPVLKALISTILPVIVKLINTLLPPILKIIEAILPVFIKLLNSIMPLFDQIINEILTVIIDLINTLLPPILQIIDAVLPVLINLMETILPILMKIIEAVLPIFIELTSAILPIVAQVIASVLPALIDILNTLTPILDMIIVLLQPILDLFIMLIEPILELVMTAIAPLVNIITTFITKALEPLSPILMILSEIFTKTLGSAIESIQPIIENLVQIFDGLIDFIANVFTGNWSGAWEAVVSIFDGIISGIANIFKIPINFVITGINTFLEALNKIEIPDWVPAVGGMGINIPLIPMLAEGGFTEGLSIAGEAGTEAVISFDPSYRKQNIEYWEEAGILLGVWSNSGSVEQAESAANQIITVNIPMLAEGGFTEGLNIAGEAGTEAVISFDPSKRDESTGYWAAAGKLLGLEEFSLSEMAQSQTVIYYDFSGFTWSPQVDASGNNNEDDLMEKMQAHEAEFFEWLEEFIRMREVAQYA
jgi:phage-related minor tail protein